MLTITPWNLATGRRDEKGIREGNMKVMRIDTVVLSVPFGPRPCGPTDKASDYESGDCRFESCQGQLFLAGQ